MTRYSRGAPTAKYRAPKLYELVPMVATDAQARKELFAVVGAFMVGLGSLYIGAALRVAGWW